MSAFVISLVVVGTALVIATRVALSGTPTTDKPATSVTPSVRGPAKGRHLAAEPDLQPVATWLDDPDGPNLVQRIRSGVLLVTLLTALGALTALALIVGGAVLLTGLRSAVQ